MFPVEIESPNEKEFSLFQKLIEKELGIHLARTKAAMLGNRLWRRLEETGCENYKEYYNYIREPSHEDELRRSLELVTTNETYFFREEKHFKFLLEEIVASHGDLKPLKVWCAACSSGEEAYSIAMSLEDSNCQNWQLIASDVNDKVLDKATEAIYLNQRTHLVPPAYFKKYLSLGIDEYSGYLRVKPEIRKLVTYQKINLMHDFSSLGTFDVIFLRNVMIYFELGAKKDLLDRITRSLNPKGWLFTGHSESLHGVTNDFECVKPAIYRKRV